MNILIAGLVNNPQLDRIKQEAEKRGHLVDGCYSTDLIINAGPQKFEPILRNQNIDKYQLIYLWAISKRRWEWYVSANYLHQKFGTVIVNQKVTEKDYQYFLSPASEYLKQTENHINYPQSALVFDTKGALQAASQFVLPFILKVSNGRQGKGVHKITSLDQIEPIIKENQENSPSFVLREFIPNDGDIRVFTIGYKAIGAMKRTPKTGDFRSNISQGGEGDVFDLNSRPDIQQIAETMSKLTRTEIAGVDIMLHQETDQPYVLEVNPGPQFTGFEQYTQINAAENIVKYFESLV